MTFSVVDALTLTAEINRFSTRALNTYLAENPHKCSYCGHFFWIMPELEEGKAYFIKTAECPRCGNVDKVDRFYQG